MKILPIALATAITLGFAGTALADQRCPTIAAQEWMPIEKIIAKAETLGYAVTKSKRSKGCWKIEGFDRNGAEIEIRFSPATGDVVMPRDFRRS